MCDEETNPWLPEDIAARAVKETRDCAKDFALRAFATAGRAEEEISAVFHKKAGRSRNVESGG